MTPYTLRKIVFFYACWLIVVELAVSLIRLLDAASGSPDATTLLVVHTIAIFGALVGMAGLATTSAFKQHVLGREVK